MGSYCKWHHLSHPHDLGLGLYYSSSEYCTHTLTIAGKLVKTRLKTKIVSHLKQWELSSLVSHCLWRASSTCCIQLISASQKSYRLYCNFSDKPDLGKFHIVYSMWQNLSEYSVIYKFFHCILLALLCLTTSMFSQYPWVEINLGLMCSFSPPSPPMFS